VAADPAAVVEACTITYVMLSIPEVVWSVYSMERGVLAGISAGRSIVDCATLAVEDIVKLDEEVVKRGGT
jgi:3-hydroxyisobutyrate dehydrogenase-like beta-hydroxyacid dehydrogenase